MKRILFCVIAGIFLIGAYFYFRLNSGPLRLLNQDTLYLNNGDIVRGWIWDDKGGVVVGETLNKEIFIFKDNEYVEIERDKLLHYLRNLI